MATLEQLKQHLEKTDEQLQASVQKAGGNKYDLEVRKLRKKSKRLARKASKIVYMEKMKEDKKKKKKGEESAG